MTDSIEDVRDFLANIPNRFDILKEGIDIETQKEYIESSEGFDQGELTENETLQLSRILFAKDSPLAARKKALLLLAHLGSILAFRELEKYHQNPDEILKGWSEMALQECKMFLESSLLEESMGFISTGLGGTDSRLRFYFLILPSGDNTFKKSQKDIINTEFKLVCKELNSILENVSFSDTYVGVTALVPLEVAVGTLIDTGITQCNEADHFVLEHYYVTNSNIPEQPEISEIINIVKNGS